MHYLLNMKMFLNVYLLCRRENTYRINPIKSICESIPVSTTFKDTFPNKGYLSAVLNTVCSVSGTKLSVEPS